MFEEIHPEQTNELQKLVAEIRLALGDWNRNGTDRPEFTYPGNLNAPNWYSNKDSRVKRKPKVAQ